MVLGAFSYITPTPPPVSGKIAANPQVTRRQVFVRNEITELASWQSQNNSKVAKVRDLIYILFRTAHFKT